MISTFAMAGYYEVARERTQSQMREDLKNWSVEAGLGQVMSGPCGGHDLTLYLSFRDFNTSLQHVDQETYKGFGGFRAFAGFWNSLIALWRKNRKNTRGLLVKIRFFGNCWINLDKPLVNAHLSYLYEHRLSIWGQQWDRLFQPLDKFLTPWETKLSNTLPAILPGFPARRRLTVRLRRSGFRMAFVAPGQPRNSCASTVTPTQSLQPHQENCALLFMLFALDRRWTGFR